MFVVLLVSTDFFSVAGGTGLPAGSYTLSCGADCEGWRGRRVVVAGMMQYSVLRQSVVGAVNALQGGNAVLVEWRKGREVKEVKEMTVWSE